MEGVKLFRYKEFLFALSIYLLPISVLAQTCDCEQEFQWIKSFMERNHPGYASDIKSPDHPAYKAFTNELLQDIKKWDAGPYCFALLKKYIRYLNDHHSGIFETSLPINEKNPDSLRKFLESPLFKNSEKYNVDPKQVEFLQSNHPGQSSIEGIYFTGDTTYIIAITKNKTIRRDYVGVIVSSKTALWEKDQVKLELKIRGDSVVELFSHLRNHTIDYTAFNYTKDNFVLPGWQKWGGSIGRAASVNSSSSVVNFQVLNSTTAYISIKSFDGQFNRYFDSVYSIVVPKLKQYPNLIIDVRGNGGGNDQNYFELMPLLYTDTIYNDFVELYVTEENKMAYKAKYDEAKANPDKYGKKGYLNWGVRIGQMNGKPAGSFVPISSQNSKTVLKQNANPSRVIILYDRLCASSCEQLLLDAVFSKKTILVGENSGGYIAYGNVMITTTPCGRQLNWTTTRKSKDRQYEFVGIPPQVRVPIGEKDWIAFARNLLAQ